jgi:hypothetical protein
MIAEPTLEHYVYYLRRIEGDSPGDVQDRRAAFEAEVHSLLAHVAQLSGQAVPAWTWPEESPDRHISQRIGRTGWLESASSGRACFVEARTYGDVYWLQVGYFQKGEAGPEIFAALREGAWQPSAAEHLLGASTYLCGIACDVTDDLATRVLAGYAGTSAPGIACSRRADNAGGCVWFFFRPARPALHGRAVLPGCRC